MLKILYAASNNENAKIVLSRFIDKIVDKPYLVKVAAYRKSSPPNLHIDWTLDCLLNMFRPDHISVDDNDNLETYFQQVKYYAPDLIISDLEYFTSYIANRLNIKLWQCSSSLINFALMHEEKYNLGLFKKYSYLTNKNPILSQRIVNIIDNSDANLVYSHLGDFDSSPKIKTGFQWIRPYHTIGKIAIPCRHNIIACITSNNKNILKALQKYPDSVVFTESTGESYKNISLKDFAGSEEYYCNLTNSNLFLCEGQTSFLADAYYNDKFSVVFPNFHDLECLINAMISEKMGFSSCIYDESRELTDFMDISIGSSYNDNIKFLHEKLDEI